MTYFRPDIADLPAYVAGKNPEDPDVIKVSSNEMPFPTLPGVAAAVSGRIGQLGNYPDMGNTLLREAIAEIGRAHV